MTQLKSSEKSIKSNIDENDLPLRSAVDFEEAIISDLILDKKAILLIPYLKTEMFYDERYKIIFEAILQLKEKGIAIELLSVTQKLRENGIKMLGQDMMPYFVTHLTNGIYAEENINYRATIVQQCWIAREMSNIFYAGYKDAHNPTIDVLKLLDNVKDNLDRLQTYKHESLVKSSKDIIDVVNINIIKGNLILKTGWKNFDENISLEHNTLILWTGAKKDGKSKLLTQMMKRILRRYSKDVIVLWAPLEDKGLGTFYNFISPDLKLKPKQIRNGFIAGKEALYEQAKTEFQSYPIRFIEHACTCKYIKEAFIHIAKENPDKLPILIVDNVLSLADRMNFPVNSNDMYDYIGHQLMEAKNVTNGQVHVIHHYKDDQLNPKRIDTGFKPELTDPKGTEVWGRICTQLLLINNPHLREELYKQYTGKDKKFLHDELIINIGGNRDDSNEDEKGIVRFLHDLNYSYFDELSEYL